MPDPTATPAPVEPRHRAAAIDHFWADESEPWTSVVMEMEKAPLPKRDDMTSAQVAASFAIGMAQGEQEGRRLERERPGLVGFVIDLSNQPCRQEAEGSSLDFSCDQTNACVTEWCDPCHARLVLRGDHLQESDDG